MGRSSYGNVFKHFAVEKCKISLDRNFFEQGSFRDSVVSYRGGPVAPRGVTFVNCRFILDLPEDHCPTPAERGLLSALLESPHQKNVQINK